MTKTKKKQNEMIEKPKSLDLSMMPQSFISDAKKFVARDAFKNFSFWEKLTEREQDALVEEGQQLNAAMLANANSLLAIGERLTKVRVILSKSKIQGGSAFTRFLGSFNFTRSHAYRLMAAFQNASRMLPESILRGANARGMEVFGYKDDAPLGKYTEAYKAVGQPPRSADPEIVNRYLDSLEKTHKDIKRKRREAKASGKAVKPAAPANPLLASKTYQLMFNWRNVKNGINHLPSKEQMPFVEDFVGMILSQIGVSQKSFKAVAVPEEFRQERGRPRDTAEKVATA